MGKLKGTCGLDLKPEQPRVQKGYTKASAWTAQKDPCILSASHSGTNKLPTSIFQLSKVKRYCKSALCQYSRRQVNSSPVLPPNSHPFGLRFFCGCPPFCGFKGMPRRKLPFWGNPKRDVYRIPIWEVPPCARGLEGASV